MRVTRIVKAAAVAVLVTLGSGCAVTLPPPAASNDNVRALRDADIQSVRVGSFASDASNKQTDSVSLRGNSLSPPQGSFADYLGQIARAELGAAGKLDDKSPRVLSGVLMRNEVDASGVSVGTASHVARFRLDIDGKRVYEKEHSVDSRWESSFMGAIAVPAAINNFAAGFQKLLHKLFSDPEFQKAAR